MLKLIFQIKEVSFKFILICNYIRILYLINIYNFLHLGLIPLHNAASYGHLDIAALLIKYDTNINATDRWGFTPLHEGII